MSSLRASLLGQMVGAISLANVPILTSENPRLTHSGDSDRIAVSALSFKERNR